MEILSDTVFRGGMQAKSVTVGSTTIQSNSISVDYLTIKCSLTLDNCQLHRWSDLNITCGSTCGSLDSSSSTWPHEDLVVTDSITACRVTTDSSGGLTVFNSPNLYTTYSLGLIENVVDGCLTCLHFPTTCRDGTIALISDIDSRISCICSPECLARRCGYFFFDGDFLNRIGRCSRFYIVPGSHHSGSIAIESCYADSNTPLVCGVRFGSDNVIDVGPGDMFIGQIYHGSDNKPVSGVSIYPICQHCSETHATIFLVEQYIYGTELYCKSNSEYDNWYSVKFLNYEIPSA